MSSIHTHTNSNDNSESLKKSKDINGNNSVASSLNSIVKKQFVNMAEQYNLYASAITEMEEKIKALKSIMLSDTFLKNCQHMVLSNDLGGLEGPITGKKNKKTQKNQKSFSNESNNDSTNKILNVSQNEDQPSTLNVSQNGFFTPKQSDSLFWCFYILCNGYTSYEYETNYFTAEQQFKIKTIEKVKKGDNKQALKDNKISKKNFESGLMEVVTPKTLYALCIFYSINVFYVHNNTYYDIVVDSEKPINVIRYNSETNNYSVCAGAGAGVGTDNSQTSQQLCDYIEKIKESHWKLETIEKPLRAITSYSMEELVNICNKLDISITDESNKKKKKAELYSSILQKL